MMGPDTTDCNWVKFIDTWTHYKEMCEPMYPSVIRNKQRTASTPEVNRLLFDLVGAETLRSTTEQQLLWLIQLVAVRGLNKEVQRQNFHSMRQKEGESLMHFFSSVMSLGPNFACLYLK